MFNTPNSDPRRIFLARVVAWPQEGDTTPAFVNIHNTYTPPVIPEADKQGRIKWPWGGRGVRDMSSAIGYIDWQERAGGRDMYFCTSTQACATLRQGKGGKPYYFAVRSQQDAVKLKALFIDIDLKEGDNGYSSMPELTAELGRFLKETGLPRPTMMVMTGGGVHVYWTLAEPLSIDEWTPLAFALAEAIRRHKLKCDRQCTIDGARILRIPGTKNFKYDPPLPVKLHPSIVEYDYANAKIEAILEPYKVKVPYTISDPAMKLFPPKQPLPGNSELSSGIELHTAQPVNLVELTGICGFVTEALATGGASFSQPLWNLAILMSAFSVGGRQDAHQMSNGHPDYDPDETDAMYDRKVEERVTRDLGWPTCAAIEGSGCNSCATCPLRPQNKTPFHFVPKMDPNTPVVRTALHNTTQTAAQATALATAPQPTMTPALSTQDADLPDKYRRNPDGTILVGYTSDGQTVYNQLSIYPMEQPWLQRNPEWTLNFTTRLEYGKDVVVSVGMKDVWTSEMRKILQGQGFMVGGGTKEFNEMSGFLMAWIQKLQKEKDAVVTSVPFGWSVKDGKLQGFVFSGELHTPTGSETAVNTDPELARQFTPTGNKSEWIDCARIVTDQKRPALDAIVASAFGAPLVRFTGHSGLLLSAYSVESGIGKSTALKIAQAVWGDPVKAVQSLSDTQNSVLNKMGELKSLPMYWDELQSEEDSKRFVDTVFRLSLGKEKSRMTSKVVQRTPGTWQTIMVAASNDSLADAVSARNKSTMAGVYRIFEYIVSPAPKGSPGQIDPTVAQRAVAKLHDNYGRVGAEYAEFLGKNVHVIEGHMASILKQLSKETGMAQDERFWVSIIACLVMGATYSNHLGFTQIDITALKTFLIGTLARMRKQRSTNTTDIKSTVNVTAILGRFLSEKRARNTILTNIIYKGRGKPPAGVITTVGVDMNKLETVMVHIGKEDRILRIGRQYLVNWLADTRQGRAVFLEAMEATLGATYTQGRLGAGTPVAGATEHLIEIDLTASPMLNFLDES